jgi:hypothetical protein
VPCGRYRGLSVAQLALRDPDYLAWAAEQPVRWWRPWYADVLEAISRIPVPPSSRGSRVVDYFFDRLSGELVAARLRLATSPQSSRAIRLPYIDLTLGRVGPRRGRKQRSRMLVTLMRDVVLASRGWQRLSRVRCHQLVLSFRQEFT